MDRMLAVIIIFLVLMFTTAAVIVMGIVPAIYQNKENINETKIETENQTEIIIKQFQRENNTTQRILQNQNISLQNQGKLIEQNHDDIVMNKEVSHKIQNITDDILNISKEHKQVARDHDLIQNLTSQTTERIDKMLKEYGENSVKQLQKLLDNQNIMNQTLQKILSGK